MKKTELSAPRTVAEGIADVLREVRISLDQNTLGSEEVRSLFQFVENSAPEATTYDVLSQRLTQLRDDITAKQKLAEEISRRVNKLAESAGRTRSIYAGSLAGAEVPARSHT